MEWKALDLAPSVAEGYGAAARPIDQVIQEVVAARKVALPVLVWICDPADGAENRAIDEKVLRDEKIAIALQKFVCLQGDVDSLPKGKLADDLRKCCPAFYFYDPAGKSFEKLEGDASTSVSRFYGIVDKLWTASFDTKIRDFNRKLSAILDRSEKLETKFIALEVKKARAARKESRLRSIAKEEEKLKKEESKIDEDRQALLADCKVKDEFAT